MHEIQGMTDLARCWDLFSCEAKALDVSDDVSASGGETWHRTHRITDRLIDHWFIRVAYPSPKF